MNDEIMPLSCITVGERCTVKSLCSTGKERNRMLDLGIVSNSQISVLQKSPSGDPTAYFIKGTVIALRSEDADKILVKPIK